MKVLKSSFSFDTIGFYIRAYQGAFWMKTICTHCQKRFKVADKHNGREVSCPECKKMFTIRDDAKDQTESRVARLDLSKEFYSVKELASLLGVNPMTIYRMVQRGRLSCYQVGRAKRFYRRDIEMFLEGCVRTKP